MRTPFFRTVVTVRLLQSHCTRGLQYPKQRLFQKTYLTEGWEANQKVYETWSFGFQFRLGKHFSDEHGHPFYYLKIGFLQYLQISGEIRYPNGPIRYWKKVTTRKEACIVHVGAIIHNYQGEGVSWSKSARHRKIALAYEHNWALIMMCKMFVNNRKS